MVEKLPCKERMRRVLGTSCRLLGKLFGSLAGEDFIQRKGLVGIYKKMHQVHLKHGIPEIGLFRSIYNQA